MTPVSNYDRMAERARARFLTYDQAEILTRNRLAADDRYLYVSLLARAYRLERCSGLLDALQGGDWRPCTDFADTMVLLDILCDSKPGRCPAGHWKSVLDFGVHRSLVEDSRPGPLVLSIDREPERFRLCCVRLGGHPLEGGSRGGADLAFALPFFQELELALQFWFGDEEFSPRLRVLWDANAGEYLRYETMYYAQSLLQKRLMDEWRLP